MYLDFIKQNMYYILNQREYNNLYINPNSIRYFEKTMSHVPVNLYYFKGSGEKIVVKY